MKIFIPSFRRGLIAIAIGCATCTVADVVVIVNPANGDKLDDEGISKIFLGQTKSFPGGASATPVDLKESKTRDDFSEKVLKKPASSVKARWAKLEFTGGGKPPKEMDSEEDVVKFVSSNPSAIGYVESGKAGSSVKVIKR